MPTMILLLFLYLPSALCSEDLQFPGCPGRDRCSAMFDATDFRFRNCECDSACVDFGDCCEDYPRGDSPKKNNDHNLKCVDLGFEHIGAYMAVGCPPGAEPELSGRCKKEYGPVTVFPEGSIYVNEHCAICNGHSIDNLIRWNLVFDCGNPALSSAYIQQNLQQANDGGWKVEFESETYVCDVLFNLSTVEGHSHQTIDKRSEVFALEDLFPLIDSDFGRRSIRKSFMAKILKLKKPGVTRRALESTLGDLFTLTDSDVERIDFSKAKWAKFLKLKKPAVSRRALESPLDDLFALIDSDLERRSIRKSFMAKILKLKKPGVTRRALESTLGDLFTLTDSDVERLDFSKAKWAKFLKRKKPAVSRRGLKFKLRDLATLGKALNKQFKLGDLFASGITRRALEPFRLSDLFKSSAISRGALRLCRAGLVSECPGEWQDDRVRAACGEYAAAVYGVRGDYRNPHCALCNGEDLRSLVCHRSELLMGRRKEFSFAHLFDVSGAGDVGRKVLDCTKDQKYDPISNTCRNLVCAIPGYVRMNDKCVKKSG